MIHYNSLKLLCYCVLLIVALAGPSWSSAQESATSAKDIVDTASASNLNTFVAAVKAADLEETLKDDGPFTVFAPSDDAFAKIPAERLEELLKPENKEQLRSILTYHLIVEKVMASGLVNLNSAKTANGQKILIKVENGKAMIGGANVVTPDIQCANGVIHVIDSVILPKPDIVDALVAGGNHKNLVAWITAAGLIETLKGDGPFTVFAPSDVVLPPIPFHFEAALTQEANAEGKAPVKELVEKFVSCHIVRGEFVATDSTKPKIVTTIDGQKLEIDLESDGGITINGVVVKKTDIKCSNGVIRVVEHVLRSER